MRETKNSYKVVLSEEDGVWLIEVVDLQGVRSFGRTVTSAVENVREAIAAAEDLDQWDDLDLIITVGDDGTTTVCHTSEWPNSTPKLTFDTGCSLLRLW